MLVMATLFGQHPFALKLYADGGYRGRFFSPLFARLLRQIDVEMSSAPMQTMSTP